MKITVNQVPAEGLYLEEKLNPAQLELETDLIKFRCDLDLKAHVYRITNALSVDLNMRALLGADCSRCLNEFVWEFKKDATLNFPIDSSIAFIDLDPNIREEVILDYPIKPLCSSECKGLCVKCGKNQNEGGCNCAIT